MIVRRCMEPPPKRILPCCEGCMSNCTACDSFNVRIAKTFLVERLDSRCTAIFAHYGPKPAEKSQGRGVGFVKDFLRELGMSWTEAGISPSSSRCSCPFVTFGQLVSIMKNERPQQSKKRKRGIVAVSVTMAFLGCCDGMVLLRLSLQFGAIEFVLRAANR
jgi:hypothetical protein